LVLINLKLLLVVFGGIPSILVRINFYLDPLVAYFGRLEHLLLGIASWHDMLLKLFFICILF
jgi:hypothetical protein